MRNSFFQKTESFNKRTFAGKIEQAKDMIRTNRSAIATAITKVLDADEVSIKPISEMRQKHFETTLNKINAVEGTCYSITSPPSKVGMDKIYRTYHGLIIDGNVIYLNDKMDLAEMTRILVHELCHYLNARIYAEEKNLDSPVSWINPSIKMKDNEETSASQIKHKASYRDEIRSRMAEKQFECEDRYLLRGDVAEAHQAVQQLYTEFEVDLENQRGYCFSVVDTPEL